MSYVLHIVTLIAVFGTVALSLDLVVGRLGRLCLAQAGFFGIGAYCAALLADERGVDLFLALAVAAVVAASVAALSGVALLQLAGEQFALATFALQVVLVGVMTNWIPVTRGPLGIVLPPARLLGMRLDLPWKVAAVSVLGLVLAWLVIHWMTRAPFGLVQLAIRDDEVFTASLGRATVGVKLASFIVGACIASVAGVLYAAHARFVDPTTFGVIDSVGLLAMLLIGGPGTRWGPLFGAALLVMAPELLRVIGVSTSAVAGLRQIAFGGILICFGWWKPPGSLAALDEQRRWSRAGIVACMPLKP